MKKLKAVLAYVAFVLAASMALSGCVGAKPQNTSETPGSSNTKILWYAFGTKQPDHNNVIAQVNKKLEEKLGIELELNVIDSGSFENKMNLSIAANEPFDICFTSNWLNKYIPNVTRGAYLPLDDLLDKYGKKLKEALPSYLLDVARYNGKLYAIPNYQIIYGQYGFSVQKGLAEKYGFDINSIKEFKDIEPFLRKVKENESGVYPLRAHFDLFRLDHEEIDPVPVYINKGDKQLQVKARVDYPEAREDMAFCADWFKKGYFRKDLLTVTDDNADVKANKYAAMFGGLKPGGDGELLLQTKREYLQKAIDEPYIQSRAGISTMLAIGKNSKHPDKAMQLIELVNTDKEIYNMLVFGIEGVHYQKTGENTINVPDNSNYKMGSSAWQFGNQFNAFYMQGQKPGIWEETDRLNRSAAISPLRGFVFDVEPVKNEVAKIQAVEKEYNTDILFARQDWEKAYDEYVKKSKIAGIDKIVAEVQRQIEVFKKSKGN